MLIRRESWRREEKRRREKLESPFFHSNPSAWNEKAQQCIARKPHHVVMLAEAHVTEKFINQAQDNVRRWGRKGWFTKAQVSLANESHSSGGACILCRDTVFSEPVPEVVLEAAAGEITSPDIPAAREVENQACRRPSLPSSFTSGRHWR